MNAPGIVMQRTSWLLYAPGCAVRVNVLMVLFALSMRTRLLRMLICHFYAQFQALADFCLSVVTLRLVA